MTTAPCARTPARRWTRVPRPLRPSEQGQRRPAVSRGYLAAGDVIAWLGRAGERRLAAASAPATRWQRCPGRPRRLARRGRRRRLPVGTAVPQPGWLAASACAWTPDPGHSRDAGAASGLTTANLKLSYSDPVHMSGGRAAPDRCRGPPLPRRLQQRPHVGHAHPLSPRGSRSRCSG